MSWTTTDVQIAFDKAQPTYDSVATIQQQVAIDLVQRLPSLTLKSILDLGCGTGFITDNLLRQYPNAHYHLLDLSEQMISGCQHKYQDQQGMTFTTANMDHYAYPKTDLIISNLAVQWSQDLRSLLQTLLNQSSYVAFTTLMQGTFQEWEDLLRINGISSPLLPLPSAQDLSQLCRNLNQDSQVMSKDYQLTFPTISAFILYLRNLGATTGKGIQDKAKFKALIQSHTAPITVTYKVFFCLS